MEKHNSAHALRKLRRVSLELISENPVFIGGLSITPVVVGATTAANGLILGLAAAFLILFLSLMCYMSVALFKMPVQKGLAAFVSAAAFIPVGYAVDTFFPLNSVSLGIYLPLLCVSSIVVIGVPETLRTESHDAMGRIVQSIIGFFVCAFAVGILREWIGLGTIFGVGVPAPFIFSSAVYPYMGFIIIAFLGAAGKRIGRSTYHRQRALTEKWTDESLTPVEPVSEEADAE